MTKPIKYAVFSKRQLLNMIKKIDNHPLATLDEDGNASNINTIVLHFKMAGGGFTGQLEVCDRAGNYQGWMK